MHIVNVRIEGKGVFFFCISISDSDWREEKNSNKQSENNV